MGSHSMKNLAFHSLLRWKMITLTANLHCLTGRFESEGVSCWIAWFSIHSRVWLDYIIYHCFCHSYDWIQLPCSCIFRRKEKPKELILMTYKGTSVIRFLNWFPLSCNLRLLHFVISPSFSLLFSCTTILSCLFSPKDGLFRWTARKVGCRENRHPCKKENNNGNKTNA